MSEVMEQGILRMPPKYWIKGHPIDELQRHNAYVAAADHLLELERENAALRVAAVEACALARVWVTVWGDKLSPDTVKRFAELEKQILKNTQP